LILSINKKNDDKVLEELSDEHEEKIERPLVHYKLVLQYVGTRYHGWQHQNPGFPRYSTRQATGRWAYGNTR